MRAPETRRRKDAQQERSRAMVEGILDAAARVLIAVGYDHASTKRIAAEAGISVGSLYQYFPTKEAVVAALMERHSASVLTLVEGEVAALVAEPPAKAVRGLVTAFFRAQHVDRRLRRIFVEQVPRVGGLRQMAAIEQRAVALARAYLQAHDVARRDLDLAAVVVVRTIAHLTYDALVDPAGKSEAEWIEEITAAVHGYLGR